MMESQTFTLPVAPSTNMLYRNLRGKGRVPTERYETWKRAAEWELKAQRPKPVDGPVSITIAINEKKTRADLGNCEKAVTDLLVAQGVLKDDSRKIVRSIYIYWSPSVDRCEVTVSAIEPGEARHAA